MATAIPKFPSVCTTHERRTCLALSGSSSTVEFIPLSIENGFCVETMPAKAFSELYQQLADYPVERCASLFAQYAMTVGASTEALEALGRFTKLSDKEIKMATAKKTSAKADTPVAEKAAKPIGKVEKAVKAVKEALTPKAKAEPKAKKAGAPSAATMFKELIMAGNLSDEKIFEKVQTAHGLSDDKFSYVKWYRKDLAKKGMNPPDAKVVKGAKK